MDKQKEIFLYRLRRELGEVMADRRLAENFTQAELAYICGVSLRTLVAMENGSRNYTMDKYYLVSIGLGAKLAELLLLAEEKWQQSEESKKYFNEQRKSLEDSMEARRREYFRQERVRTNKNFP